MFLASAYKNDWTSSCSFEADFLSTSASLKIGNPKPKFPKTRSSQTLSKLSKPKPKLKVVILGAGSLAASRALREAEVGLKPRNLTRIAGSRS